MDLVRHLADQPWTDQQVIERILAGEGALFELLMRRHNERVYRTVRAILRDEAEVEDVMQAAYLHAFAELSRFEGRSQFVTWLTRIAIHEALARKRRLRRVEPSEAELERLPMDERNPEERTMDGELRSIVTRAIDGLPEHFRVVFVLRVVQELSGAETAVCLGIPEETVKTRLHRARALLRRGLTEHLEPSLPAVLPFEAPRCDRLVSLVMGIIAPR
jgi:RNA polymerase sigma-70 factor (ECF subfamily)